MNDDDHLQQPCPEAARVVHHWKSLLLAALFCMPGSTVTGNAQSRTAVSVKEECLKTMVVLVDSLLQLQISQEKENDFGAIKCPSCNVLHTRAAEAVYPFAVTYQRSGQLKYLAAAKSLGNWLLRQQLPDGSWKETPEEWTGTTTDQLLMMVLAYQKLQPNLSRSEADAWVLSMKKAADYLVRVMNPEFASINYCTTTTATLATMNRYFPNAAYLAKARELARQVLAAMDEEGFIQAEGERVYNIKYGTDVGYEIDMSLWGLEIYARLADDRIMHEAVASSLRNHLYFVYPNGAIDGSWGIRSNKWTTYGSATADGSQILFSLFAKEDARYRTAAIRNLEYLRTMIRNGLIGYGPQYFSIFSQPPCIYFTGNELRKTVKLRYHGKRPQVDVVEPLVWLEGMQVKRVDSRRLRILGPKREFLFEVTGGTARLEAGSPDATLFNVFPSIRCLPVYLHLSSPKGAISDQVTYRIAIVK